MSSQLLQDSFLIELEEEKYSVAQPSWKYLLESTTSSESTRHQYKWHLDDFHSWQ
jgi:hypothetical protein